MNIKVKQRAKVEFNLQRTIFFADLQETNLMQMM
jgi:hypothetical protein